MSEAEHEMVQQSAAKPQSPLIVFGVSLVVIFMAALILFIPHSGG